MFNRINKIDNDARRKVIEKTKSGKVHEVRESEKTNDSNKGRNSTNHEVDVEKKYITIDCVKNEEIKIDAEKKLTEEELIGNILDKRR